MASGSISHHGLGLSCPSSPPFSDLVWSALGLAGAVLLRGVVNVPPPFRLVISETLIHDFVLVFCVMLVLGNIMAV